MCTAMTLQTVKGEMYFGRTMDFSYPLDPALYIMPRNYQWKNALNTNVIHNHYGYMGIGQKLSELYFADGVNEQGFAAAVLYFPGYAKYSNAGDPGVSQKIPIAAIEMTGFLLGQCASVSQAAALLRSVTIVGVEDSVTNTVAPLHWILCDKSGDCAVAEHTGNGLDIYRNPIGVLSNSPDFTWQMANLRNYMKLSTRQIKEVKWGEVSLTPFGQGGGTVGLPGDFTPPSRFVRTAFLKTHIEVPGNRRDAVTAGFHILGGVTIPKGIVLTEEGRVDYTQYTSFMNLEAGEYYFKTYENSEITTAKLENSMMEGQEPVLLGKLKRNTRFFKIKAD